VPHRSPLEAAYEDLEAARTLPDNEVFHDLAMVRKSLQRRGCPDDDLRAWCERAAELVLARNLPSQCLFELDPLEAVWSSLVFIGLDTELAGLWPEAPLPNLLELQLRGADIDWLSQPRCDWPHLRAVHCFDEGSVARGALRWLARQRLPSMRRLSAHQRGVTAEDFRALLRSEFWAMMRHVDLRWNALGSGPAPWPSSMAVETLQLERVGFDDEALASLVGAQLPKLRTLDLSGNDISLAGLRMLVDAPLPGLRRLAARGTPYRHNAIWTILREARWPDLEHLDISGDGSDPGDLMQAAAIVGAAASLDLASCHLGNRGTAALATIPFTRLRTLSLAYNDIGPDGARALARAPLPDLEELDLAVNPLGDDGLRAITSASWWTRLTRLSLVNTGLTEAAIDLLASHLPAGMKELRAYQRDLPPESFARMRAALHPDVRLW
jgi:hypothetical protein